MPASKLFPQLFYLSALEGTAVIAVLLSIPSEGGTLSAARILLIAIALFISLGCLYMASLNKWDLQRYIRPRFILLFAFLSLASSLILFLLRYLDPVLYLSPYERLSPLLWYFLAICIQISGVLLYLYKGLNLKQFDFRKDVYSYALPVFGILLFLYIFVAVTRLGVTFDPAYWGEPGVPLMGWQFALGLLGGFMILSVTLYGYERILDLSLPLLIYALTLGICLSVPVNVLKTSFYMPIIHPSVMPYPFADAAYYDRMAQSVLIGHPYLGEIPTRPLYILLLTLLHLLFGQDFSRIIAGQTVVLALLPVILYFMGRKLHSRTAGTLIALFFIFRELTSLLISSDTRVTNTKMILVDLPTLLLLLLTYVFVFRWLETRKGINAFAAGGMFGLLLLLRIQSLLVLPFIILFALLVLGWRNRSFYRDVLIFLLGLAITILPWLTHNYMVAGEFAFEAGFENRLLAHMYIYKGNAALQNMDVENMGLAQIMIGSAIRDPKHVFGFIANHFLATQVNGLMALPLIKPYHGLHEPINLYWMNWQGELEWYNALLLIIYLALISIGIGAAWKHWKWLGLLPLAFSIAYTVGTAISRYSSWRYDYPADWISYFYIGIGFAEVLSQGALIFGSQSENLFSSKPQQTVRLPEPALIPRAVTLALIFMFVGVSPWLITKISAPRYQDQSLDTLGTRIALMSNTPTRQEIDDFSSQPGSFFQSGRLLYPRFFRKNLGLSSATVSPAFTIRDYPRLGFLLLNQSATHAVFPAGTLPASISHAADTIVLGCQRGDHVEVRLMAFPESDTVYMSAPLSEPCSP